MRRKPPLMSKEAGVLQTEPHTIYSEHKQSARMTPFVSTINQQIFYVSSVWFPVIRQDFECYNTDQYFAERILIFVSERIFKIFIRIFPPPEEFLLVRSIF
jgi:hypothetical protein